MENILGKNKKYFTLRILVLSLSEIIHLEQAPKGSSEKALHLPLSSQDFRLEQSPLDSPCR